MQSLFQRWQEQLFGNAALALEGKLGADRKRKSNGLKNWSWRIALEEIVMPAQCAYDPFPSQTSAKT